MQITHFTHGRVNPQSANGVNTMVLGLGHAQLRAGHMVRVLTFSAKDRQQRLFTRNELAVECYPDPLKGHLWGLLALLDRLSDLHHTGRLDVLHIHLAWNPHKIPIALWALSRGVPYIVSTHCGYTADRIAKHRRRKQVAAWLWELPIINQAAAVHVICHEEISDLRQFGVTAPLYQAYNGIDRALVPASPDRSRLRRRLGAQPTDTLIGFLGRVAEEKNVDRLIRAVGHIPSSRSNGGALRLVIIGPYTMSCRQQMKELARAVGLPGRVHFVGPLYGEEKFHALAGLDLYVHPAWSDVVSLAVLEALACGVPCVVTRSSYISYLFDRGVFEMVEPWPEHMAKGIEQMLERRARWPEIIQAGYRLLDESFNWDTICGQMMNRYQSLPKSCPAEKQI